MTFSRRILATLFLGFTPIVIATPALAQRSAADIESARQAYNQGMELKDKGDLKGAAEKFKAAHALGNTPITGLELCKTHAALAQPVEAREACLSVSRIPPIAGETQRSAEARNEAIALSEQLKGKIAAVRLRVRGVPAGREPTVVVDGYNVPLAALNEPRAVNPGHHSVVAKVGNGPETRGTFDLREGETKDVELVVQAPANEPPPPPPGGGYATPRESKGGMNATTTVGLVIAGIGGAVGIVGGAAALSAKGELQDRCTDNICGREDHKTVDNAYTWAGVATAGFVVCGVGLLITLIGVATNKGDRGALPPSTALVKTPPQKPTFTPDLGGFHGTF